MKKIMMLLSFALLIGIVSANAQDKKPTPKKEPAKTEAAKHASSTKKSTPKPDAKVATKTPVKAEAPKSAMPINK